MAEAGPGDTEFSGYPEIKREAASADTPYMVRAASKAPTTEVDPGFNDPRRKHQRHHTKTVSCALGEVLDMSAAGLRLSSKSKPPLQPGRTAQIRLAHPKGDLIVAVELRWLKRTGLFRYEMGLQFLDVTPQTQATLDNLARFGFVAAADGSQRPTSSMKASVVLPDYYRVLGLKKGATPEDVRAAYRELAKKFHPDRTAHSGLSCADAAAGFMRIQEAYDVLNDAEQRTTYDGRLAG